MKRLFAFILILTSLLISPGIDTSAAEPEIPENAAKAYILVEATTGMIMAESNSHVRYPPASVTKIMTMLLVVEAIESGAYTIDDMVQTSDHAASMGGSQIWLEPGEKMSVRDLFKTVAIVSANDSAVALAEFTSGSEESFVEAMNSKAAFLGMTDTTFINCTGLEAEGHLTSAYDIALMSRELVKHEWIFEFTTTRLDSVRNGESELTNTNKLLKRFEGITGLKTGFTKEAKYCISATAERNGLSLIGVILGGETTDLRFEAASTLLNFGFANYKAVDILEGDGSFPDRLEIINGKSDEIHIDVKSLQTIILAKNAGAVTYDYELPEYLKAPVEEGERVGTLRVYTNETQIAEYEIVTAEGVAKLGFFDILASIWKSLC